MRDHVIPFKLKKSIPVEEHLRCKRNCSTNEQFKIEKREVCDRQKKKWDYSDAILNRAAIIVDKKDSFSLMLNKNI